MIYKFRDTTAIDTSLQTKEGSLVTIENPDEVIDLKSLTVDLEPIQDLNGYDKPWAGGAGKNKLPSRNGTATNAGLTFSCNGDGVYHISSTSTSAYPQWLIENGTLTLPVGTTFTLSNTVTNAPSGAFMYCILYERDTPTGTNLASRSTRGRNSITFTIEHPYQAVVVVAEGNGLTYSNATITPQIEVGSTATAFEPYSNICPISGHTSIDTNRTGKNLLVYPYRATSATINGITFTANSDGSVTANGTTSAQAVFTLHASMNLVDGDYILTGGIDTSKFIALGYFDSDSATAETRANATTSSGARFSSHQGRVTYVQIVINANQTVNNLVFKPMIRLATETDSSYEPYQGNTYTTALGRTVYGGNLEQISGVLADNMAMVTLDGSGSWGTDSKSGDWYRFYIGKYDVKKVSDYRETMLCSGCEVAKNYTTYDDISGDIAVTAYSIKSVTGNWIYIASKTISTIADLKAWLTQNPLQVVYELATPQTYQLTAQQISLLLGDNNIWSNGGNVTVTYAIDPALYQGMPTEAVSINGRFLEKLIDGYRTLYTKGRESLEVELGTYSTGTADGEKIKNHRYPARVLTVGFQLLSSTPEEFRERFNQLNNILSLEEADFIFADETDKFFTGTPIMDASVEAGQMNVTGEWKIYCGYPFKRSVQPITLTSTTDATISGNTATFNFNYKGVMPSKPLLRCEFASAKSGGDYTEDGDCGFVAFLNADESIIQLGNPEVIDVDATNKNEALINSEFDAFTGWTNSGKTIRSINDPYWNNGAGQTQNYASGVGTLRRNIASTIGFELDMVHRLSVSSPTQTGTFKTLLKNGNTTVVGFSIEKTGSGTAGTVKYIINDKVVGTDAIDLSQYNEHFGYCNRTPVYVAQTYYTQVVTYVKKKKKKKKKKVVSWVANTRWVQSGWNYTQSNLNSGISRDGAVVTFSVGELPDRTFKDSDIATKPCTSISIESTGTFDTNAVRSVALIQKAGVPFAEIPNVFTAGDIVEADCNSANVFLYRKGSMTGHLEPQYGALGNDWEDFEIKVGQNAIRAVWSDWVNTNYKPVIKIIFNEVYI